MPEEFRNTFGYDFEGTNGSFYEDFMKLFQAVYQKFNGSVKAPEEQALMSGRGEVKLLITMNLRALEVEELPV
ncbi:hypothetical protein [Mastigocladopsis repens]|uniref:hypothetical protein n=1 Tax=Mastigocladopsis repens TaxID=221287 RepID=UPI00031FDC17|nr:hypothetical protein [Mastigocladopsis repens]